MTALHTPTLSQTQRATALATLLAALPLAAGAQDSRAPTPPAPLSEAVTETPAGAASVHVWHAAARNAIARHKPNQQAALRLLAYLSWAQHRAAQAMAAAGPHAGDAAWSALFDQASARTLSALLPAQAPAFQALSDGLVAARQDGTQGDELARARLLGEQAASETLARAGSDGFDAEWKGSPPEATEAWHSQLQPPRPPHLPLLGSMKPLFLSAGNALRPTAPPAVGSASFKQALAEVRSRAGSAEPQALVRAKRWEMTSGSLVAGFWDEATLSLAAQHGLNGRDTSRALALAMGATLDANIACHDAKYHYWTPRPPQADAAIRPRIGMPNHPSYPSNHSCDSGAAATVLGQLFPAQRQALNAMAIEAGESRIDAGIHYRFDIDAGMEIGRAAAAAALGSEAGRLARQP